MIDASVSGRCQINQFKSLCSHVSTIISVSGRCQINQFKRFQQIWRLTCLVSGRCQINQFKNTWKSCYAVWIVSGRCQIKKTSVKPHPINAMQIPKEGNSNVKSETNPFPSLLHWSQRNPSHVSTGVQIHLRQISRSGNQPLLWIVGKLTEKSSNGITMPSSL